MYINRDNWCFWFLGTRERERERPGWVGGGGWERERHRESTHWCHRRKGAKGQVSSPLLLSLSLLPPSLSLSLALSCLLTPSVLPVFIFSVLLMCMFSLVNMFKKKLYTKKQTNKQINGVGGGGGRERVSGGERVNTCVCEGGRGTFHDAATSFDVRFRL